MGTQIELNYSPVVFKEEDHSYWLGDKQLKGITSTLIHRAYPHALDGISQEVLAKAAERGHAIHDELMNMERWGVKATMPETEHYLEERDKLGLTCIGTEFIVSDEEYYASAIDNISINKDGEICLIDYKTFYRLDSTRKDKTTLQLNIYRHLFEMQNPHLKVEHLYIAWFRETKEGSHREFIELPFIDPDIVTELIKADIVDDETYIYNPAPAWTGDFEVEYLSLLKQKEKIEEKLDNLKKYLFERMIEEGQHSFKTLNFSVSRIEEGVTSRFDSKAFEEDNPELYKKYIKSSPRGASLRITKNKK